MSSASFFRFLFLIRLLFVAPVICPLILKADLQSLYGIGSSSAALSGSNRTHIEEAYNLFSSPAVMSTIEKSNFSIGYLGATDDFKDLENVMVSNETYGGNNTFGDVDTDVEDTSVLQIASILVPNQSDKKFRMGFVFVTPVTKLMSLESQSSYYPQYAMYFSDTQRLLMNFAVSWQQWENIYFGLGAHFSLATGSSLRSTLPATTNNDPRSSSIEVKLEVKPKVVPSFSFLWQSTKNSRLALNYIAERNAEIAFDANNDIGVLGSNSVPVNFEGLSSLYYDPQSLSLAYTYSFSNLNLYFAADYEMWSNYSGSVIEMDFEAGTTFEQFPLDSEYKDILSYRLGASYASSDKNTWRISYAYRPSPVPEPKDNLNFLDSDRQMIGLGYGRKLEDMFSLFSGTSIINAHIQTHILEDKDVKKSSNSMIGNPGYSIGGNVYSYGISFQNEF